MKVLLIIPAYNEAQNIVRVINGVLNFKRAHGELWLDYVIINDGSTDNTSAICKENGFNVINLIQNLGIGGAVQTGYMYAKQNAYDIAVQFDGDGQHDIECLLSLLNPIINEEKDFVIGSRFLIGTSEFKSTFMRRVGIHYLSTIIKLLTKVKVSDPTSGFRAANKRVIQYLADNYPTDYPEPESVVDLIRHSFKIIEVQVNMHDRMAGSSSISSWRSIYYMIKVSLAIICSSLKRSD